MTKAKNVEQPEVSAPEVAKVEPVQLTIADLQVFSRVVDLASRRGAFQANELTQVGAAFDKLSGFLAFVEQEQAKASIDTSVVE